MTLEYLNRHIFPAAFELLPPPMDSPEARAMLLAIGLQESKFIHRVQVGGPARGFWQFERRGGVIGVMVHPATKAYSARVCADLRYPATTDAVYRAMAHHDILAACFARLLLWTLPSALPSREDLPGGWSQYLEGWRPGKPHADEWRFNFTQGWAVVEGRTNA